MKLNSWGEVDSLISAEFRRKKEKEVFKQNGRIDKDRKARQKRKEKETKTERKEEKNEEKRKQSLNWKRKDCQSWTRTYIRLNAYQHSALYR